jgi:iron(III) transport system substrate-binding protein
MTRTAFATLFAATLLLPACSKTADAHGASPAADAKLLVYVALDEEFSRPVLDRYGKELGITLQQQHDTEAAKTVGLVSAIKEERSAPRCSVFWNNELANTVSLAQAGLLQPYVSPAAADLPAAFRDPEGRWTGFAARARILIVNTELLPDPATWPRSYRDLIDPKWRGRCGVARPKTGTTLTHFAALRLLLGEAEFGQFLTGIEENQVKLLSGNGAAMREVRDGKLPWAFTDTDDYHVAMQKGFKVACVFPDQHEGGIGTMLIPNSVGIVTGAPNLAAAQRLVDKIVSAETEALLAAADGAQIPLRANVTGPKDPSIPSVGKFRAMAWDPTAVGRELARSSAEFGKRF